MKARTQKAKAEYLAADFFDALKNSYALGANADLERLVNIGALTWSEALWWGSWQFRKHYAAKSAD